MGENKTKVRRSYTTVEKESLLKSFQTSGKSSEQWCRENQVGLSTLQRWRKSEVPDKPVSCVQTWMPVVAITDNPERTISIQAGAFRISVSNDTNIKLLADVLSLVKAIC